MFSQQPCKGSQQRLKHKSGYALLQFAAHRANRAVLNSLSKTAIADTSYFAITTSTTREAESSTMPKELEEEERGKIKFVWPKEPKLLGLDKAADLYSVPNVSEINAFFHIKTMSVGHHETWILGKLRIGNSELELLSHAERLVKQLNAIDNRTVRNVAKLTP